MRGLQREPFGDGVSRLTRSTRYHGRFAWTALVVFAVAVAALGIWTTRETLEATAATRHVVRLADGWKRLRIWLVEEETRERKYLIEHDRIDRPYHAVAVASVTKAAAQLRELSPVEDHAAIDRLVADNRRYGRGIGRLFAASDARDGAAGARAHAAIDPSYDDMEHLALGFEQRYGHDEYLALAALEAKQRRVAAVFPVLVVLGILALTASFFVFGEYRRRYDGVVNAHLEQLESAALDDALTGLGNHRAFRQTLARLQASQPRDAPFHLALIDVDRFKSINDRFGHVHGDGVLRAVGALLRDEAREARAFRIGGDEFALVFGSGTTDDAVALLDRLRGELPHRSSATLSIGVATRPWGDPDLDAVHERADLALYEAKHRGRDRTVVYDTTLVAASTSIASRRHLLERILGDPAPFDVAFQPIRTIAGDLFGYEALTRQYGGFGSIGEVFDTAERLERTAELDARCIASIAAALPVGFAHVLFVNVSPASFRSSDGVLDSLAALCDRTRLDPARIVVEVTERSPLPPQAAAIFGRLRSRGFRIALDDFGSGNAGLEAFARVPVDVVKIDGSLVSRLATDARARAVVGATCAMVAELSCRLVCEGVETTAVLEAAVGLARRHGVEARVALQGFAIGRPGALPASAFANLV
jgi:diguanylate cyclase (GGDEF)-like protein